MTPKSVKLDPISRAKRLALIRERYEALVLRPRHEIEADIQNAFTDDDDFEPAIE